MTADQPKRIDVFRREAGALCPGFLYSFNIADFKRRNLHLSYGVGDADILELERALKAMASDTMVVSRVSGQRWFLFSRIDADRTVQGLLESYKRTETIWTGWQVDAENAGQRATRTWQVESEIRRALRCLRAEVQTPDALSTAIAEIDKDDYNLPVDRIIALTDVANILRNVWRCVTRYPEASPMCPFCSAQDFDCEGGDDSIYTGYGRCNGCSAHIDIRQL